MDNEYLTGDPIDVTAEPYHSSLRGAEFPAMSGGRQVMVSFYFNVPGPGSHQDICLEYNVSHL